MLDLWLEKSRHDQKPMYYDESRAYFSINSIKSTSTFLCQIFGKVLLRFLYISFYYKGPSFYFCRLCSTARLMVGWCEIAEYRSLSYTYFSKEEIETGFHLFLFLREFAFYFNYTIVVILFFMHSHSTPQNAGNESLSS